MRDSWRVRGGDPVAAVWSTCSSRSGGGSEVARMGKATGDVEIAGDDELGPKGGGGLGVPESVMFEVPITC